MGQIVVKADSLYPVWISVEDAGISKPITSLEFGAGWKSHRGHLGEDYAYPTGRNVRAAYSGTVVGSDFDGTDTTGWGNYVVIRHENHALPNNGVMYSQYAHLNARHVDIGDTVMTGDVIGTLGDTGFATGSHLHFEIKTGPTLGRGYIGTDFTTYTVVDSGMTYYCPSRFIEKYRILNGEESSIKSYNIIFNWLESEFPEILSPTPQPTHESDGIYFRYYPGTNVYIGTIQNDLYFYDHLGVLHNLGGVDIWLPYAQTKINNVVQSIYFSPNHLAGVPKNTWVESNEIGVVLDAPIRISADGEYRINNASWTSENGQVKIGDKVRIRLKSSTRPYTSVRATLYIGSSSGIFIVTTSPRDKPDPFSSIEF